MIWNFCLIGNIRHNFLVPRIIELAPKIFMHIQTPDLHRVRRIVVDVLSCLLYKVQIYFSVISWVSCPTVTRTMRKFEGKSSGKNYSKIPTIVSTWYQKFSKALSS